MSVTEQPEVRDSWEGTMDPETTGGAATEADDFDLQAYDWDAILDAEDDDASTDQADDETTDEPEGDEPVDGDDDEVDEDVDDEDDTDDDDTDDEPESKTTPQTFTVKVQGEEVSVTIDELLSGYMRHADYTRKTQATAEDARAAAAFRALQEQLNADPVGAIAALQAQLGLNEADTQDLDPLEREVAELRQWRAEQERNATQAAIQAELGSIQTRYGIADDAWTDEAQDALLKFAVDNGIGNLDVAYKAMTYEAKVAKTEVDAEGERQRQAKVAAKRKAPKVASGAKRSAKTTAKGASEYMSVDEALAETLRELRG